MKSGIYSITNLINGKIYYGSSNNIYQRFRAHKSLLKRNKHSNIHLQSAWLKYGENTFKFEILIEVPIEQLLDTEQSYLDKVKEQPELYYNMSFSADCPMRGRKHTMEASRKISTSSANRKRKPLSEQHKKAFFQGRDNHEHGMLGKKHTDKSKLLMSESAKGRIIPQEVIDKIRLKNIGKKRSNRVKQILSFQKLGEKNPMYGKSPKNIDLTIYHFNHITGEKFIGIRRDFYKRYNLSERRIKDLVKGYRKSHKGWQIMITK